LEVAASEDPPWILNDFTRDGAFIRDLLGGDSTSTTLGAGDLTILVERDRYAVTKSLHRSVSGAPTKN
jgi:hypothetical protein